MHFFLSSFGLHNPYISGKIPDHGIYPVATEMADGLDLDYTSLLLGQNYVIDKTAFEDICSGRRPFLNRMAETLKFLQREEILLVRDLRPIAKSYMRQLKNKTEAMLADPLEWLPEARAQWHAVGPYMKEFQIKFGKPDDAIINTAHFGVYSYLQQRDGAVNQRGVRSHYETV